LQSPEKDQEYFCDGMTEELISELARITGLIRTSLKVEILTGIPPTLIEGISISLGAIHYAVSPVQLMSPVSSKC